MSRQSVLLAIGLMAIIASLGVRNSQWARERRLKNLNLEDLALAIHDDPNDSLRYLYYGGALLDAGKAAESEQAFGRAVKLDPVSDRAVLGMGSAQLRQNKLPEAHNSFQEAIKLNPKSTEAYLGLAQTDYRQGYALRAAESLKKIIALNPNSAPTWYFLGKMYGDAHASDLALDADQRAVKIDPTKAIYWRDLGQLQRHYSHSADAEQDLKRSLQIDAKDPVTYLWLGQLYLDIADTPQVRSQAEQNLKSAISLDPSLAEAYFALGQLYERMGSFSIAATTFDKACQLDSTDDKSLHYEGECLVRAGKVAEGNKLLAQAAELETAKRDVDYVQKRIIAEPKSRELHLRLARLYRKYENHPGALNQYAAYQNLGAEDPAVRKEMEQYQTELIAKRVLPPRPAGASTVLRGTK